MLRCVSFSAVMPNGDVVCCKAEQMVHHRFRMISKVEGHGSCVSACLDWHENILSFVYLLFSGVCIFVIVFLLCHTVIKKIPHKYDNTETVLEYTSTMVLLTFISVSL